MIARMHDLIVLLLQFVLTIVIPTSAAWVAKHGSDWFKDRRVESLAATLGRLVLASVADIGQRVVDDMKNPLTATAWDADAKARVRDLAITSLRNTYPELLAKLRTALGANEAQLTAMLGAMVEHAVVQLKTMKSSNTATAVVVETPKSAN